MHHRYTPMKYVVTIALAGTLLSCASPSNTTTTAPAPSPTGEGQSFATAIRVPSATERDGITWERIYLAHHYRGRLVGRCRFAARQETTASAVYYRSGVRGERQ